MSQYDEACKLCHNAVLADTLLKAEACRFRGNPSPYAALETHLSRVSLPSVPTGSFMGASFAEGACGTGDSVVSTVLAVCYSVKNLDCVVHLIKDGQMNAPELTDITSRCLGGKESVVLSVPQQNKDCYKVFNVCSTLMPDGAVVDEASAMKILLSVQSASNSMIWYWSPDLLGYSYLLNSDSSSMWALSLEPHKLSCETENLKVMMPSERGSIVRIIPFFYSSQGSSPAVVMGTGGVNSFCRGDLAVEVAALSRVVTDRAYCSTASSGRCFCCEYLNSLHSTFHVKDNKTVDVPQKLELSRQFWQSTKGQRK